MWWWPWKKKAPIEEKTQRPSATYDRRKITVREVTKREQAKWQELGIATVEADNIEEIFGYKLDPFRLESQTWTINSDLAERGFTFALTPKDLLGTLVDQEAVNRRRHAAGKPSMSALEISIWREADRLIRKEGNLARSVNIPARMLEDRVRKLCNDAEKRSPPKSSAAPF